MIRKTISKIIKRQEFYDTIKFAIIAFVILPLLPNEYFSITDLIYSFWYSGEINNEILTLKFFNPYTLWMFVVLVSWISYTSYILSKFISQKSSIIVSWFIWWIASATALTASMSAQSKKDSKNADVYVIATMVASIMTFLKVIIVVWIFDMNIFVSVLIPSSLMLLTNIFYIICLYRKSKGNDIKKSKDWFKNSFEIAPAFKFAFVILVVEFISKLFSPWADSAFGSSFSFASSTVVFGLLFNNLVKWFMALKFWNKEFWKKVMRWFSYTVIAWLVWIMISFL